ncbi:serine/threonine-protein kinase HipA [Ferrimonas marina]|uniref:Serine/threonine-protein kinase HipA n=1 Tax=Ferrimonas marina TaxID=299255 RepID=A0A1M5TS02_9GAMM|nr:serine/threonine-protein kinase HipA [Ferrimonas marina]
MHGHVVGKLSQTDERFTFEYSPGYRGRPIAISLPVETGRFESSELFPYFSSLAPEGWLKKRYSAHQRIDERDLLGLLLANGENLIGAVQLRPLGSEQREPL